MMRLLAAASLLLAGMAALADEPPPAPEKDVDVAKTTERVVQDAKEAGQRLADKDPGSDTQQIQKNILKNLDELLRKAHQPPPPMNGSDSSSNSKGGMSGSSKQQPMGDSSKQPMGDNSNSAAQRKERREKKSLAKGNDQSNPQPSSLNQRPDPQMDLTSGKSSPNKIVPKGNALPPRLPDVYKDVWGQLPEKMRQEMDLYFREDFMPRYSELLRQYYSSLAERNAKK